MLTEAREWEFRGRQRLPVMFWMFPMWLLWSVLLLPGQVLLGNAASVTWGHVNKYASVLHTEDVYLTPSTPGQDLVYGSQNASDNYRITGIHVEDLDGGAEAHLTAGGIGQQFVVLHCRRLQGSKEEKPEQPAHLEVSLYGVEL
ncbi:uncharacterized protein [Drosophila takahashii]|uniref:uncharacterized protein n=1 Tax=Drosophila takahashii TaxID=29030 RepID=UPI0007E8603A|nr:uncharacterized protein LOC108054108 [Drosophila takahashii]